MSDENAYAVRKDDRDLATPQLTSSGSGCVVGFFGILIVGFAVLALGWIATGVVRSTNPPKPQFSYGDAVEVIDGFHKGRLGEVSDCRFWTLPDPLGRWEYMVTFDRYDTKFIPESELRKLSHEELIFVKGPKN